MFLMQATVSECDCLSWQFDANTRGSSRVLVVSDVDASDNDLSPLNQMFQKNAIAIVADRLVFLSNHYPVGLVQD